MIPDFLTCAVGVVGVWTFLRLVANERERLGHEVTAYKAASAAAAPPLEPATKPAPSGKPATAGKPAPGGTSKAAAAPAKPASAATKPATAAAPAKPAAAKPAAAKH